MWVGQMKSGNAVVMANVADIFSEISISVDKKLTALRHNKKFYLTL